MQNNYAFLVCSNFSTYGVVETHTISYFDGRASIDFTSKKDVFQSLDVGLAKKMVTHANNSSYPIKGVGEIY